MYPIILITDSIPSADGGGISQTLYNLLDNYNGTIVIIEQSDRIPNNWPILNSTILPFQFEQFKSLHNRLGKYVNPWVRKLNFKAIEKRELFFPDLPSPKQCFVLVSTTSAIKLYFAWLLHKKHGYTVVPYFMDDWMQGLTLRWKNLDIHNIIEDILKQAPIRLMISKQLNEILKDRYNLPDVPTHIVHNPAPPVSRAPYVQSEEIVIVYAGSIWPMHRDALIVVSNAIDLLIKEQFKAKLIIYCTESTWGHNKHWFNLSGTEYGGFVAYAALQSKLEQASFLLVTSSFDPSLSAFTKSSVQTKITDYMAAGRPLLYVGPKEGASGQFISEHECGWCIYDNNPINISSRIKTISSSFSLNHQKANNGRTLAEGLYSKKEVQSSMYKFIFAKILL